MIKWGKFSIEFDDLFTIILGVVIVVGLLSCCAVVQASQAKRDPLYENPLAYRRSPESSISLKSSRYMGSQIKYFEGALGLQLPIVTLHHLRPHTFQLGVEVASWITLGYQEGAFPLLLHDYLIAVPVSFRSGKFSAAIKYNHISAHLGDGMNQILEENLSGTEKKDYEFYQSIADSVGVDIALKEPLTYSREFISAHVSYEFHMGWDTVGRVYAHGGYIYKIIPRRLKRYFIGNGLEVTFNTFPFPYLAQDTTYNADTDTLDYSAQAGIILLTREKSSVTLRVAFTGYIGSDRRGQMLGRKLKQIGFGIFLR